MAFVRLGSGPGFVRCFCAIALVSPVCSMGQKPFADKAVCKPKWDFLTLENSHWISI